MTLQIAAIDELVGFDGIKLVGATPEQAYHRPAPRLQNVSLLAPDDLVHLERTFANADQTVPGMRLYEIPNAVTLRTGEVIVAGRYLIRESVAHSRPPGRALDALVDNAALAAAPQMVGGRTERHAAGLLLNQWSYRNYGHFLVEILPKAAFARDLLDLAGMALLVNRSITGGIQQIYADALARLGLVQPLTRVLRRAAVERLLFATTAGAHGVNKYPWAVHRVRSLFLTGKPEPWGAARGRRLWIHRRDEYKRRLTNQAALMEIAAGFGFEIIAPETLSVAAQAALFAEASACIGPIGAGFSNILFCRPGTAVLTLCPNAGRETFFYDLACITGTSYACLFGPAAEPALRFNSDFSVEPGLLSAALETLS